MLESAKKIYARILEKVPSNQEARQAYVEVCTEKALLFSTRGNVSYEQQEYIDIYQLNKGKTDALSSLSDKLNNIANRISFISVEDKLNKKQIPSRSAFYEVIDAYKKTLEFDSQNKTAIGGVTKASDKLMDMVFEETAAYLLNLENETEKNKESNKSRKTSVNNNLGELSRVLENLLTLNPQYSKAQTQARRLYVLKARFDKVK